MNRRPLAPIQVSNGKGLADNGNRLGKFSKTERPFFCRHCGLEVLGINVPPGWYSLTRHTGTPADKPHRLGVYCSLSCLVSALPRLQGVDQSLAENWEDATSAYRHQVAEPTP